MDRDYALLARIVEAGSLSAAGRALNLSPSMVSKRLARLEQRLGAQLIVRTTRGLALTDVGRTFHDDVLAILAASRTAEARVAGRAETPVGPLRISAPTSFGRMHIAPYLAGFLELHPGIELDLGLTDAMIDLVRDRIDVAIRIDRPPEGSLAATQIAANERILCAAPEYIDRHGTPASMSDLARHSLLTASHQTPWRLQGPKGIELIHATSLVRTNSSEVVRELALSGLGIALRSYWDIAGDLTAGRLRRVLPLWQGDTGVGIFAIQPRSALPPIAVRHFVDYLAALYTPRPPWLA